MFKRIFRVKEIQKGDKTLYMVQEKFFLFWWDTLTEPIESKDSADALCMLLRWSYTGKL